MQAPFPLPSHFKAIDMCLQVVGSLYMTPLPLISAPPLLLTLRQLMQAKLTHMCVGFASLGGILTVIHLSRCLLISPPLSPEWRPQSATVTRTCLQVLVISCQAWVSRLTALLASVTAKEVAALLEVVQAATHTLLHLPTAGGALAEGLEVVESQRAEAPGYQTRLAAIHDRLAALSGYGVSNKPPSPPGGHYSSSTHHGTLC